MGLAGNICLPIHWLDRGITVAVQRYTWDKKIMMEMKSEKRSRRFVLVSDGSFGFLFLFMYVLKILVGERFGFFSFLFLFLLFSFGSPFEITKAI